MTGGPVSRARSHTGAALTDLSRATGVPTGSAVARISLLVDTGAATAALPRWAVAVCAAGTGPLHTRLTRGADVPTRATVVRIGF